MREKAEGEKDKKKKKEIEGLTQKNKKKISVQKELKGVGYVLIKRKKFKRVAFVTRCKILRIVDTSRN